VTSFQRFARGYRDFAVYFLNTVLMAVVVAGVYFLVTRSRQRKPVEANPITKYGIEELLPVYPGRSKDEIAGILKEAYERPLIYEPFTHFRELPATGRFVNVAAAGYRLIEDQGPWPMDPQNCNVFVFGGSTTFGYGVADAETIPSSLQKELRASLKRVCVYNFGRGFYYSSQERILFSNLLAAGIVPDVAVFIDGLNEFYRPQDAPQFSGKFMILINQSLHERKGIEAVESSELLSPHPGVVQGTQEEKARKICERYLRNKVIIGGMARAHGTKTAFVWQPVPTYKFDLEFHPFSKSTSFEEHLFAGIGHQQMAQIRLTNAEAAQILWLADMQENAREPLYVDAVHYTAKQCGRIAAEIARFLREQSVIPQR
jgi:hypothetical protein